MIWWQVIFYAVTLVLSIALAPKPKAPKSAALEDFDFPTAEEGRPIPVVFGEVDIAGPNVLWYGDLQVKSIKKRAGFKKSVVGYKYNIGWHQGMCHGPVDAVTGFSAADKTIWTGNATANTTITLNLPNLFGGDKREGGIVGSVDIMMGADSQTENTYLAGQVGPGPAYIGVLSLVMRGSGSASSMYIGTTAYPKAWTVRVRRILQGWQGGTAWYATKAAVGSAGLMNGAHIVYQAMTDSEWGMGIDVSLMDDAVWRAAADKLYAEDFGLALMWNQSTSCEAFIQAVCDHIGAALGFNLTTGKYELVLVRGDYDIEALPTYGPETIKSVTELQTQGWGETVNEVTLVYTDPDTRKDTSITQQDLANIDAQGKRIAAVVELPGIRSHSTAATVLARELASRVTPLSKTVFEANRNMWATRMGGLFRMNWPERNIEGAVFRVLNIGKGTLENGNVSVEALADIYALGVQSYLGSSAAGTLPTFDEPDEEDEAAAVKSTTLTAPPASPQPVTGDTYFVPAGATGAWAPYVGQYVTYDPDSSPVWVADLAVDGELVYDSGTGSYVTVYADGTQDPPPWTPAINTLTEDTAPNLATDFVPTWDTSAAAFKKVLGNKFVIPQRIVRGATWVNAVGITVPVNPVLVHVPVDMLIKAVTVIGEGGPGNAAIAVSLLSYASFPGSFASICGASPPTLTAAHKYQDSTLTGWTTAIPAGSVLKFELGTVTAFTFLQISVDMERST